MHAGGPGTGWALTLLPLDARDAVAGSSGAVLARLWLLEDVSASLRELFSPIAVALELAGADEAALLTGNAARAPGFVLEADSCWRLGQSGSSHSSGELAGG